MFFSKATNFFITHLFSLRNGQYFCLGYFSQMHHNEHGLQISNQSKTKSKLTDMAASGEGSVSNVGHQEKGNGLLLYLNNYSFYAQKVSKIDYQ